MCYHARTLFSCGHFEWDNRRCKYKIMKISTFPTPNADISFNNGLSLDYINWRPSVWVTCTDVKRSHWYLDRLIDGDCAFCRRMLSEARDKYSSRLALQARNLFYIPGFEPRFIYNSASNEVNTLDPSPCEDKSCRLPDKHSIPHLYQYCCRDLDCVLPFNHDHGHRYRRSRRRVDDDTSDTSPTSHAQSTLPCDRPGCGLPLGHPPPHQDRNACSEPNCVLSEGHPLPHTYWRACSTVDCVLHMGHGEDHRMPVIQSKWVTQRLYEAEKEKALYLRLLDDMVFRAMKSPNTVSRTELRTGKKSLLVPRASLERMLADLTINIATMESALVPYSRLDASCQQIRLLELYPGTDALEVQGSFCCVELSHSNSPKYIALSYTWGEGTNCREIKIDGKKILVRENLWWFLRLQSCSISEPKLFWIDAICINQSDIGERNHQVGMMRQIYVNAADVYIWLGPESDDSDIAMEYISKKSSRKLKATGLGFRPVWSEREGKSLVELCERPYWRRMWIIQEVINARHITVWCGTRSFEWELVEMLYQKLRVLESTSWLAHHAFATAVFQSSAGVIIWQRAYWRHPDTPTPSLQMLIEVFHGWQCADIRDKVYALVGMASTETAIVPDYSKSTLEIFCDVRKQNSETSAQFHSMLLQVLALSKDPMEPKQHSPKYLLFKKRHQPSEQGTTTVADETDILPPRT